MPLVQPRDKPLDYYNQPLSVQSFNWLLLQMSTRLNPTDVDLLRQTQDLEPRCSRSTETTPRSPGRRRHQASHFAKDTSSKLKAAAAGDSSTSSDDDDDRCRIIPATADDDYLERLDQKVSEVISRSRLGNISANLDLSSSEHFGQLPLNLHGRTSSAKKSSPGSAHRISRTPRTSESTVVHSSSTTPSTTTTMTTRMESTPTRTVVDGNVKFVEDDASDSAESSLEDFEAVVKASKYARSGRWSEADDNNDHDGDGDDDDDAGVVSEESDEDDDEGNFNFEVRRRR